MASIENLVGMRRDSLRHFRQILQLSPTYLPVLIYIYVTNIYVLQAMTGLASVQLSRAIELFDEGAFVMTRDALLEVLLSILHMHLSFAGHCSVVDSTPSSTSNSFGAETTV